MLKISYFPKVGRLITTDQRFPASIFAWKLCVGVIVGPHGNSLINMQGLKKTT